MQSKRRKTPAKRGVRKNKTVVSSAKTAALCAVIVAACFILLFINTEHGTDSGNTRGQQVSRTETTQEETGMQPPVQSVRGKNTEETSLQDTPEFSGRKAAPSQAEDEAASSAEREPAPRTTEERTYAPSASSALPKSASVKSAPVQQEKNIQASERSSVQTEKAQGQGTPELPAIPPAVNNARLVFVFDDAGQNVSQLEKYVALPFPITVAVLPKLAYSKACADRVRKSGNEVMLHQPMQAVNRNVNPGPGAITPDMPASRIAALVRQNIAEIGPVAGVNNHEGSLISEDEVKIGAVMQAVNESGAFFLDSRTTSQTRVPQASMELGIPYYERNVFLDNSKDRGEIVGEIMRGLDIANTKGAVIMIGHVWSADVLPAILIEMYPALKNKGYVFTTVSRSGAIIRP